ncbi:MAG: hypothetical protein PHI41_03465 [Erysipelotrichaceae bacterium]|nr:hypothetical protein [Erysipelotrichaceae bacterium]MDD3809685.1 hypothetical protein [Erysipelotrichaceae bacterium]
MSKRTIKRRCYQEQLEHEIISVQTVLNKIMKLPMYENIDQEYLKKDLIQSQVDLELALAGLCIILRKMHENSFLRLDRRIREDINSIIHANRFEMQNQDLIQVHSQQGYEEVRVSQLLNYSRKFIEES